MRSSSSQRLAIIPSWSNPIRTNRFSSYFSEDHTLYEFQVEPLLAPFGKTSTLRFSRIPTATGRLSYSQKDPGFADLPQTLQDAIDDDPTTLDVVTDSSGRALIFTYQQFANTTTAQYEVATSSSMTVNTDTETQTVDRIVKIKGYDPQLTD